MSRQYVSSLASEFSSFVALKRALGCKYTRSEHTLLDLDRFLARHHPVAMDLSLPILSEWLHAHPENKQGTHAGRLYTVRKFCLFRRRTRPGTYVPDRVNAAAIWPKRSAKYVPHIYTTGEVRSLLRGAKDLASSRVNARRSPSMFTLLLLLYATGMRVSEALSLTPGDIMWDEGVLRVRDGKCFRSRLLPLSPDVIEALRGYRDASVGRREAPFFRNARGCRYLIGNVEETFRRHLRPLVHSRPGRPRPRIHDLRHTFAVGTVARWYREGRDVQNMLPRLATYLGHTGIALTQYYLQLTEEIARLASDRFETTCSSFRGE